MLAVSCFILFYDISNIIYATTLVSPELNFEIKIKL